MHFNNSEKIAGPVI